MLLNLYKAAITSFRCERSLAGVAQTSSPQYPLLKASPLGLKSTTKLSETDETCLGNRRRSGHSLQHRGKFFRATKAFFLAAQFSATKFTVIAKAFYLGITSN